ncbi:MAG: beta-ketoacyl synthase chain length factor [Candidatus Binataceae bacterium]
METRADWTAWSRGERTNQDEIAQATVILPPVLRRRISTIGQMAFRASFALSEQRAARLIFCSRHGEFDRTLRILQSLAAGEPVSPADFSLSVHNALAGLLSIAWRNTAGHTTVSGGADSFTYGLLEGLACLRGGSADPVMLVYFEDRMPPPYDEIIDQADTAVALAILLAPPRNDRDDFRFGAEQPERAGSSRPASAQALDFIRFMLSSEREQSSTGERIRWRLQRCA